VASDDKTDSGDKTLQYQEFVDSSSMTSFASGGGGADSSSTTFTWTSQTWEEYKTQLMCGQGIICCSHWKSTIWHNISGMHTRGNDL
jgi:hypothetical protein